MGHLRHQKLDTWFSVKAGAIDFKRGWKCSSPHRWSADTEQDGYIPMSQRTITSSQCVPWGIRNGTLIHEKDKSVWCLQFSMDMHLLRSGTSSLSPVRHVLLTFEASWNSLDWPCSMPGAYGTRNGTPWLWLVFRNQRSPCQFKYMCNQWHCAYQ